MTPLVRCRRCSSGGSDTLPQNGTILRSNSFDSDVYLLQEADVLKIHANAVHNGKRIEPFAMAVQFFSDATLLSWNGSKFLSACTCVSCG